MVDEVIVMCIFGAYADQFSIAASALPDPPPLSPWIQKPPPTIALDNEVTTGNPKE
jgi:hypothetical protein